MKVSAVGFSHGHMAGASVYKVAFARLMAQTQLLNLVVVRGVSDCSVMNSVIDRATL